MRSRLLVMGVVLCGLICCFLPYHRHRKRLKVVKIVKWVKEVSDYDYDDVNEWAELGRRLDGAEDILLQLLESPPNRRWEWLRSYEEPESWDVAHALYWVGSSRSVPTLIAVLEDRSRHSHTRAFCAYALGNIGDHRAFAPLCRIVKSREEDTSLRIKSAHSLATLGDPNGIPVIEELIQDDKLTESNRRAGRQFLEDLKAIQKPGTARKGALEEN